MKRFTLGDALRGIAAIGVVALHTHLPLPLRRFNELWPDFFFVLSGYVLAKYYSTQTSDIPFRSYALRRIVRFYPLVLVVVLARILFTAIGFYAFGGPNAVWPSGLSPLNLTVAALLLQVFFPKSLGVLAPLWSLSVELITNLGLFNVVRRFGTAAIVVFTILGLVPTVLGYIHQPDIQASWFTGWPALGRAVAGFGCGLLLTRLPKLRFSWAFVVATALATVGLAVFVTKSPMAVLPAPFVFAAVMQCALWFEESFAKTRWVKAATFLGTSSYGIYVWHWAMLPFGEALGNHFFAGSRHLAGVVNFVVVIALTLVATRITYRLVEKPSMDWVSAKTRSKAATATANAAN